MANVLRASKGAKQVFQVRTSAKNKLGGMRPDLDPMALGPLDFTYLENVRRIGGGMLGRAGSTLFAELTGEPVGLSDFQLGANRRLMVCGDGCPGISDTLGFYLGGFSREQLPRFQSLVYYPASVSSFTTTRFTIEGEGEIPDVDALMFSTDNVLRQIQSIPFTYGELPLAQTGGSQEFPTWTIPSVYSKISAIIQHGSVLLLALVGVAAAGVGSSAIYTWDGQHFEKELGGINPVTGFALFRDTCIVGFGSATNAIQVRSALGTYTTFVPGAGTIAVPANFRCASYKDRLYIPTGGEDIYRFDGATLTRIQPATSGVDAGSSVHACEVGARTITDKAGFLFYSWSTATPKARIGRTDATTWTASHKDLRAQFPTLTIPKTLRWFQGCLVAGALNGVAGASLYFSPRAVTSGTYEQVDPSANNNGDINELVLF